MNRIQLTRICTFRYAGVTRLLSSIGHLCNLIGVWFGKDGRTNTIKRHMLGRDRTMSSNLITYSTLNSENTIVRTYASDKNRQSMHFR